jgi:hypothetical protein
MAAQAGFNGAAIGNRAGFLLANSIRFFEKGAIFT